MSSIDDNQKDWSAKWEWFSSELKKREWSYLYFLHLMGRSNKTPAFLICVSFINCLGVFYLQSNHCDSSNYIIISSNQLSHLCLICSIIGYDCCIKMHMECLAQCSSYNCGKLENLLLLLQWPMGTIIPKDHTSLFGKFVVLTR